jgi:S-adenosylmethionine hydrolase
VLLTDFGDGPFQGVMKGVILSRAPGAAIVDLDHHVRPGGVLEAAWVLAGAADCFPDSSVFCCVVDPGVGTSRRRILVACEDGRLGVGPDNGVLSPLLGRRGATVREITNRRWFLADDTRTFEGRSRFAPAAAALASGSHPRDAGPVVRDAAIVRIDDSRAVGGGLSGQVICVDPFGNLVTSIVSGRLDALGPRDVLRAVVGRRRPIPLGETYASVAPGSPVAYVGSTGHLEIGIRGGSASLAFGVGAGALVRIRKGSRRP